MNPGDIIADRFRIERLAGSGGMGSVFRAEDRHTGEPVALKIVRSQSEENDRRFSRESQLLAELRHPGIVRYVAHGRMPSGELYLAMEWLEGESLSQRLTREGLTAEDTVRLGLRVAEALSIAHARGIVHRDLKPSNLVLVGGHVDQTKLLDFGVARLRSGRELTQTGALIGTPGYMAPEQARGERDLDSRVDVFALGCVLFKCLTGRSVFEGDDVLAVLVKLVLDRAPRVRELRPEVPEVLDDLVARMLSKAPEDRPKDGAAVAVQLARCTESVLAGGPRAERAAQLTVNPPSLTATEQRVICLVLARFASSLDVETTLTLSQIDGRHDSLRRAVEPYGGRFDVLADGSILVTLSSGTPTEQAARAARCALAMAKPLGSEASMALVAGWGVVSERVPMGKVIDRAVRLVASEGASGIRLDDVAAALLGGLFDVARDEGGLVLRGARAGDAARTLLGKPTTCVGREREIANLEATIEECISEPVARVVLVTAVSGAGKSRLRYEFLRKLRQRIGDEEVEVWVGRGDPMSVGSPFGMIAPCVRQAAGLRPGEPLAVRQEKLTARVQRHVSSKEAGRVTEFLGELIGTPFPDEASMQLRAARQDAMLMGDQMRRAWEDWLSAESEAHPVLIVLEDLHWGDLPSVKFVDAALRNLRDRPLMVLALARPDIHELFPKVWAERDVQEVRLGALTRKASERLIRQVLGDDVPARTVERLVEHAGGNAFYLEELIRAVAEGHEDKLPDTVLAMVQARLEALEGEARRVLRAASVFGQVFWHGGVSTMLGGPDKRTQLDEWLDELIEKEIVSKRTEGRFPGDEEYIFRNALVREAAYAMLTEGDRVLGHKLAGEWLEKLGESEAVMLAEHFERGGEPARAVGWYRRGAEQALEGNDLEAAVARAERGVACGAKGEALGALRLLQADAHRWRGEFADMERCALEAMGWLLPGGPLWCSAAAEVAVACRALGKRDRLVALVSELSAAPGQKRESELDEPYVIAAARIATQLFLAGRADLAEPLLARIEKAAAREVPTVAAWIHQARSFGALFGADPGAYLVQCQLAAERFEEAGDLRSVCNARVNLGFAYMELGGYKEAEQALRDALAAAERMGLHNVVATAKNNLGIALARLGALDEAKKIETQAIEASANDRRMEGASRHYLATILTERGDLEEAEAEAKRAVDVLEVAPPLRAHALATLANVRLARGDVAGATVSAGEALALLESLGGIEEGESLVRLVHAEALSAAGDVDGARRAIAVARDKLNERAEKIKDPALRTSFLERVPDNARTLERAKTWASK